MIEFDNNLVVLISQALLAIALGLYLIKDSLVKRRLEQELKDTRKLCAGLRGRFDNLESDFNKIRVAWERGQTVKEASNEVVDHLEIAEELISEPQEKVEESKVFEIKTSSTSVNTGLKKTRSGFFAKLKNIFGLGNKIDQNSLNDLEQLMIESDLGVKTTYELIDILKAKVESGEEISEDQFVNILKTEVLKIINDSVKSEREVTKPEVYLLLGVNGVGKTTSTAKLAKLLKNQGKKVLLVAADTFRAAAVEQLKTWGIRLDLDVVAGPENAKPQTVVYEALTKAQNENYDCIIVDTAGRLHNKSNLMQELEGIKNIISKFKANEPEHVLMVVDGNTGANAVIQAKEFNEACALTGIIVSKLDGTPKGGVVVAIKKELGIPVEYIGIGEGVDDLKAFEPKEFVDALFDATDIEPIIDSVNAITRRQRREASC